MGHKVYLHGLKKQPENAATHFSFPMSGVELSPEVIKHCKLARPLKRLAEILASKYKNSGKPEEPTIGVEFGGIEFCLHYGQYKKKGGK